MNGPQKTMNLCCLTGLASFSLLVPYLFALLLFPATTSTAAMQNLPSLESPPLVRITGAFFKLGEPTPPGLSTLTVSLKDAKWSFVVKKMESLTGRSASELRLLERLFPPALRFTGPPDILDSLWPSNAIGKFFVLEGRLYIGDRMLFLLSAEEE
ncbi:MAG: hypothetical protein AB7P69_16675 [Candidatus Binatia bacterium]